MPRSPYIYTDSYTKNHGKQHSQGSPCTCMNHSSVSNGDRQPPAELLFRAELFPISTRRVTRLATVNGRLCPTITTCWSDPESEFRVPDRARVSSLLVRETPKQREARWCEWLDPSIKKTRRRIDPHHRRSDRPAPCSVLFTFCELFRSFPDHRILIISRFLYSPTSPMAVPILDCAKTWHMSHNGSHRCDHPKIEILRSYLLSTVPPLGWNPASNSEAGRTQIRRGGTRGRTPQNGDTHNRH